jgi:hypothetical protein
MHDFRCYLILPLDPCITWSRGTHQYNVEVHWRHGAPRVHPILFLLLRAPHPPSSPVRTLVFIYLYPSHERGQLLGRSAYYPVRFISFSE